MEAQARKQLVAACHDVINTWRDEATLDYDLEVTVQRLLADLEVAVQCLADVVQTCFPALVMPDHEAAIMEAQTRRTVTGKLVMACFAVLDCHHNGDDYAPVVRRLNETIQAYQAWVKAWRGGEIS